MACLLDRMKARHLSHLQCPKLKRSSIIKREHVLRLYLLPRFGRKPLKTIRDDEAKTFLAELVSKGSLSRNSLRLILCTLRVILNHAEEDELIDKNPVQKLTRFVKIDREQQTKASALSREESERFLASAREVCPALYPLFLTALQGGLRRGELIALKWGDIQFGADGQDLNRYMLVQRNWLNGSFTSPKSRKSRRVDLSRQLRAELLQLRDQRMLEAFLRGTKHHF